MGGGGEREERGIYPIYKSIAFQFAREIKFRQPGSGSRKKASSCLSLSSRLIRNGNCRRDVRGRGVLLETCERGRVFAVRATNRFKNEGSSRPALLLKGRVAAGPDADRSIGIDRRRRYRQIAQGRTDTFAGFVSPTRPICHVSAARDVAVRVRVCCVSVSVRVGDS
jgi:hypothetical protein